MGGNEFDTVGAKGYSLRLHCRKRRRHVDSDVLSVEGVTDDLPRVHCSEISATDFRRRYEAPKIPVIVTGLCESWPAREMWTEENMLQSYSEHRFKVHQLLIRPCARLAVTRLQMLHLVDVAACSLSELYFWRT